MPGIFVLTAEQNLRQIEGKIARRRSCWQQPNTLCQLFGRIPRILSD